MTENADLGYAARIEAQLKLAKTLALSSLLGPDYKGKPENVMLAIQYAESMGIHPITAMTGLHIMNSKPTMSAQLMTALVKRAGHLVRVIEATDEKAVVELVRADDPSNPYRVEWDLQRAQKAGLLGNSTWKKYPRALLVARATSEACRNAAPDALFGVVYTPEELGAVVNEDGEVLSVPAQPEPVVVLASQEQKARIRELAAALGMDESETNTKLARMSHDNAEVSIANLEARLADAQAEGVNPATGEVVDDAPAAEPVAAPVDDADAPWLATRDQQVAIAGLQARLQLNEDKLLTGVRKVTDDPEVTMETLTEAQATVVIARMTAQADAADAAKAA